MSETREHLFSTVILLEDVELMLECHGRLTLVSMKCFRLSNLNSWAHVFFRGGNFFFVKYDGETYNAHHTNTYTHALLPGWAPRNSLPSGVEPGRVAWPNSTTESNQ